MEQHVEGGADQSMVLFPLISWGRVHGSGFSAQVVSTKAHRYDPADESETICGRQIPTRVQPSRARTYQTSSMDRVFPDDAEETAKQPRCASCERLAAKMPGGTS